MESIYYAVKAVAFAWLLMSFFIFLIGGDRLDKEDRGSKYLIMLGIVTVLPAIRYVEDAGPTAMGAITSGFPLVSYAGFGLFVLGIVIHWTGIITLKKQWSVVVTFSKDHQLIDTGIYRFIRHPIYTGILLELLGLSVALANWLGILLMVLPTGTALVYRIWVEEQALQRHFGETYINYAKKTKRLIPGMF